MVHNYGSGSDASTPAQQCEQVQPAACRGFHSNRHVFSQFSCCCPAEPLIPRQDVLRHHLRMLQDGKHVQHTICALHHDTARYTLSIRDHLAVPISAIKHTDRRNGAARDAQGSISRQPFALDTIIRLDGLGVRLGKARQDAGNDLRQINQHITWQHTHNLNSVPLQVAFSSWCHRQHTMGLELTLVARAAHHWHWVLHSKLTDGTGCCPLQSI